MATVSASASAASSSPEQGRVLKTWAPGPDNNLTGELKLKYKSADKTYCATITTRGFLSENDKTKEVMAKMRYPLGGQNVTEEMSKLSPRVKYEINRASSKIQLTSVLHTDRGPHTAYFEYSFTEEQQQALQDPGAPLLDTIVEVEEAASATIRPNPSDEGTKIQEWEIEDAEYSKARLIATKQCVEGQPRPSKMSREEYATLQYGLSLVVDATKESESCVIDGSQIELTCFGEGGRSLERHCDNLSLNLREKILDRHKQIRLHSIRVGDPMRAHISFHFSEEPREDAPLPTKIIRSE